MKRSHTLARKKFLNYKFGFEAGKKKYKTDSDHLATVVCCYDEGNRVESLREIARQIKNFAPSSVEIMH